MKQNQFVLVILMSSSFFFRCFNPRENSIHFFFPLYRASLLYSWQLRVPRNESVVSVEGVWYWDGFWLCCYLNCAMRIQKRRGYNKKRVQQSRERSSNTCSQSFILTSFEISWILSNMKLISLLPFRVLFKWPHTQLDSFLTSPFSAYFVSCSFPIKISMQRSQARTIS